MRRAGDVCFSQVFRDRDGELSCGFTFLGILHCDVFCGPFFPAKVHYETSLIEISEGL